MKELLDKGMKKQLDKGMKKQLDKGMKELLDKGMKKLLYKGMKELLDEGMKELLDKGMNKYCILTNTDVCLPLLSSPGPPLPQAFNVINGGSHAGNKLAMQEFMVLPVGAESFRDAVRVGAELYQTLREVIKEKYGQDATNVGDEGGFAPNILENTEGERDRRKDISKTLLHGPETTSVDPQLSGFSDVKETAFQLVYIAFRNTHKHSLTFLLALSPPVVSIEDPFDQDDWPAWSQMTASVGIQVVGDDLTVTNPKRIERALEERACNCLLLKVNQIGSVTEAIQA
nr:gamma-enolase-like [Oncorhynchus nerka]